MHAPTPVSIRSQWMTVEEAAAIISVSAIRLRRNIQRHARRMPGGLVVSATDGVHARKLGSKWQVALDSMWLDPTGRAGSP